MIKEATGISPSQPRSGATTTQLGIALTMAPFLCRPKTWMFAHKFKSSAVFQFTLTSVNTSIPLPKNEIK